MAVKRLITIIFCILLSLFIFCQPSEQKAIAALKMKYVDSTHTLPYTMIEALDNDSNKGSTPDEIVIKFGKAKAIHYDFDTIKIKLDFSLDYGFHIPPEDMKLEERYQKRWRRQFDVVIFIFKNNHVDHIFHSILK